MKREIHVTITGDASDLIAQLEKATEAAKRLCKRPGTYRSVFVRPRDIGANLSVDVDVDGFVSNVCIPPNFGDRVRIDYFSIGGHEYSVRVAPGQSVIRSSDIDWERRS